MDVSPTNMANEEIIRETQNMDDTTQPEFGGEEEDEDMTMMEEIPQEQEAEVQVVEDEEKDMLEDELRERQRVDSVSSIAKFRMKPEHLFRLNIPLCRMVSMPLIRQTLECDIDFLDHEYTNGYRDGAAVFYVTTTNEAGESSKFTQEEMEAWGPLWREENNNFNLHCDSHPLLRPLKNVKFFVCDGNHRLLAWMRHIKRRHPEEKDWHRSVDSILLETKGRMEVVMHAMNDINW